MRVFNLCQQLCSDKIPVQLGEWIGEGADGEAFIILDQPDKVIKFSIIYDRFRCTPRTIYFQKVQPIVDYIMTQSPPTYARVYAHGYLGEYSRHMAYWKNGLQTFVIHYCIMEKLLPLTVDEKKVFHSLVSHEDRGIKKDFSDAKIRQMLAGLARGLDFDIDMIMLFCAHLRTVPLIHRDLHPRNIMRHADGYFKLVDFDSVILEK